MNTFYRVVGGAAAILDQLLPFLEQWEGLALPVMEK